MQEQITYTVEVFTKNSKIFFRGRNVRTPVKCEGVFENEINSLKSQIKANSLNFNIKRENEKFEAQVNIINKNDSNIVIEDLFESSELDDSTLGKLLRKEKDKCEK